MHRLTIEVSETDVKYIDEEIAAGHGLTAAEILAKALTAYRKARGGLEELDRLGQEAEASGEAFEITPEYWARKDREYQARRKAAAQ